MKKVEQQEMVQVYGVEAAYIDRFYLTTRGPFMRLSFAEEVPDTNVIKMRAAVMSTMEGAKQLHTMLGQFIEQIEQDKGPFTPESTN